MMIGGAKQKMFFLYILFLGDLSGRVGDVDDKQYSTEQFSLNRVFFCSCVTSSCVA